MGGVMESRTNPLGWPTWAWRCLVAFTIVFTAYGLAGTLSNFARAAGLLNDNAPVGMTLARPAGTPSGWSVVTEVASAGPAKEAGLARGDLVHFELPGGWSVRNRALWPNPLLVERDGERFRTVLVAHGQPEPGAMRNVLLLAGIQKLVAIVLGTVLLIRGRRNRAAVLLGLVLLAIGSIPPPIPAWIPGEAMAPAYLLVGPLGAFVGCFWLLFALEISGGSRDRRQVRIVGALAVATVAIHLVTETAAAWPANLPLVGSSDQLGTALVATNQVLGYLIISLNYRRNDPTARNRIKIVLFAFVCFFVATVIGRTIEGNIDPAGSPMQFFWSRMGSNALGFAGLALLVSAVMRRQLFDLNFALNRTLVYGTVSFVLLAGFGIAKWVIEHLIPETWHEGSEFYSFGIALLLFLSLHRVHDWVERSVERVFFSPWHQNEAALRRFVAAAGHFEGSSTLCSAFSAEATRFAKGAGAALYLRSASGSYGLSGGNLTGALPAYPADDLALALMRAERRPVKASEVQTDLPGVLALPILDHAKLAGFLLLDRKGDGTDYRPDEIEVLGWAAQQIGLDLQAMRASELEAEVGALHARLAALSTPLAAAGTRRRARGGAGATA
jgi:hypothetical protein